MHRRWRFRGAQEEFVDIGFVEAVFVVAQIIANDDGAAFFERTVNFVATKGEQHDADLFAVFRNMVGHRLGVKESHRFLIEQACEQAFVC